MAEDQILNSKRRTLVNQAKVGRKTNLQSKHVQNFIDAYNLESADSLDEALESYKEILDGLSEEGLEGGYLAVEVKERIDRLENYLALPANKAQLNLLLARIRGLSTETELLEARKQLNAIVQRFGDNMQYKEICLLYTSPSPRDATLSRMPSSA